MRVGAGARGHASGCRREGGVLDAASVRVHTQYRRAAISPNACFSPRQFQTHLDNEASLARRPARTGVHCGRLAAKV
eukprot:4473383-Pleurochrysis_carterae.AAC.1